MVVPFGMDFTDRNLFQAHRQTLRFFPSNSKGNPGHEKAPTALAREAGITPRAIDGKARGA